MSAYRELRERAEAEAWLAGGLCLMRLARPVGGEHVRMAPWILGALSDAGALPPVGVIVDIGQLVLGRSLTDMASMQPLGPELQGALCAYEDNVLGRLEADPRLDAVIDAVARLPEARRDAAIALFCVHLVQRLAADQMVAVSPGAVRRIVEMPAAELYAIGDAVLFGDSPVLPVLVSGYRALVSGARRAGMLISEAAVFLMENFAALGELTQRLAIEQMIEAADALAGELPRRLKPRPERGEIPTPLAAEDNYPTGGFSSLSTSGSLENLVTSELVYMEDIRPDVIDLFELRYAEGELLYYTRDESVFVRGRRVITFALMPDLEAARCKDRELEWQRLVILFAVILSVIRRLAGWLEGEGLRFRLLFVTTAGSAAEPLAAESGLAALLLREWIDKQVVEIARAASLSQIYDEEGERARTARTELIVIATEEPEIQPIEGVLVGAISLADVEPRLIWAHRAARPAPQAGMSEPQPGAAWRAWTAMTIELIQELL